MIKITEFSISRLHTEEDFGFQKRIEGETALLSLETDKPMVDAYIAALTAFDKSLKGSRCNSNSADLIHADELVDAAWMGLKAQTTAMLRHPAEENRKAATETYELIRKYGNVSSMARNEEYGSIHNLLQDLNVLGEAKQKLIHIDEWVQELQTRYDEFRKIEDARDAEDAKRITGIIRQSRTEADAAFRTLVERVNALALVNGDEKYATFISHVNVIIDEAHSVLAARETRAGKKIAGKP